MSEENVSQGTAQAQSPAKKKKTYSLADAVFVVAAIMIALKMHGLPAVHDLEDKTYDLRLQAAAKMAPVKNVSRTVLVPIDEMAVQNYGRWPWSRDRWAIVLSALADVGVNAAAFDVEFPEKSDPVLKTSATGKQFQEKVHDEIGTLKDQVQAKVMIESIAADIRNAFDEANTALQRALQLKAGTLPEQVRAWLPGAIDPGLNLKLAAWPVRMLVVPLVLDRAEPAPAVTERARLTALARSWLAVPPAEREAKVPAGESPGEKVLSLFVRHPLISAGDQAFANVGLEPEQLGQAIANAHDVEHAAAFELALEAAPLASDAEVLARAGAIVGDPDPRPLEKALPQARARALSRSQETLGLSAVVGFLEERARTRTAAAIEQLAKGQLEKLDDLNALIRREVRNPDDEMAAAIKVLRHRKMPVFGVFFTGGGLNLNEAQVESATDQFIIDLLNRPADQRKEPQHPGRMEDAYSRILRGLCTDPTVGATDGLWTGVLAVAPEELGSNLESARQQVIARALDVELAAQPDSATDDEVLAALAKRMRGDRNAPPFGGTFKNELVKQLPQARSRHVTLERFLIRADGDLLADSPRFRSFTPPILELANSYSGLALSVMAADPDGVMRRVPVLRRMADGVLPGVSFMLFLHALGFDLDNTASLSAGVTIQPGPVIRIERQGSAVEIPVDTRGSMLLRMQGSDDDPEVLERVPISKVIDYVRLHNRRIEIQTTRDPTTVGSFDALEEFATQLIRTGDKPLKYEQLIAGASSALKPEILRAIEDNNMRPGDRAGERPPSEWRKLIGDWRESSLHEMGRVIHGLMVDYTYDLLRYAAEELKPADGPHPYDELLKAARDTGKLSDAVLAEIAQAGDIDKPHTAAEWKKVLVGWRQRSVTARFAANDREFFRTTLDLLDAAAKDGDHELSYRDLVTNATKQGALNDAALARIVSDYAQPGETETQRKPSGWREVLARWRKAHEDETAGMIRATVGRYERGEKKRSTPADFRKKWGERIDQASDLEEFESVKDSLRKRLEGKMVVIGASFTGNTDKAPTPFATSAPNYALHAHGVATYMSGQFIRRPPHRDSTLIPVVVLAIAVGLILPRVPMLFGAIWTAFLIALWGFATTWMLAYHGAWLDFMAPAISIACAYLGLSGWRYGTVEKSKQVYRDMFAAYLDERVIEQFVERPELFKEIGGTSMEITAFFSDIEGFTTISEILNAEQLSAMLADYLSPMTDIIQARGGLRDKYIGDAIVAMFGAPIHSEDHAVQGCLASLEQRDRLAALKQDPALLADPKSWLSVLRSKGRDFNARMGVNTGMAKVGNFGSHKSKNYTMIGDTVNLAARLEGANKAFQTYLMISEFAYAQARAFIEARPLDSIRVKGKLRPVTVYELMAKKGGLIAKQEEVREIYVKARELYLESRFSDAIAKFKEALAIDPKDGPSLTLMHRSEHFIEEPPPKDWDGTYDLKEK